ncbi:MAG: hypothetical protein M1820_003705 [Bogoriella megaspora]|nr:MAG: hypothetical protein M1820_003705 [Bogoriella megaspora]
MFKPLRRLRLSSPTVASNQHLTPAAMMAQNPSTTARPGERESVLDPYNRLDPFTYTSGRWLKNDKLEREARYVDRIIRQKKKEGSYNRVFLLHMDNGARVVARVPFQVAGPRRLITNSEVATTAYIRAHTKIPIPRVLDWSDDPANPTGTEYIIMEHATGVPLHEKWNAMNELQKMLCVKSAAILVKEMAKLPFPAYGSLYFANAPINSSSKVNLSNGFCIGPHCATRYWCLEPGEFRFYDRRKPNRGPWTNLSSFCSGLIDSGISQVPTTTSADGLAFRRSIQEYLSLLDIGEQVIGRIIESQAIQNVAEPMLLHPDFHKRNIFVSDEDPTCITAVIDWQSTGIEPVFSFANETPDMVSDPLIDKPLFPDELNTEQKQNSIEQTSTRGPSICEQTFEVALKGWVPKLHGARVLDENLLRPIRYCHTSWRDGPAALRQELIELFQRWDELGLQDSCPYQPPLEELAKHAKEWDEFVNYQTLKRFLIRSINSATDGWVPPEAWEAAKDANRSAFEEWMVTAAQSEDPDMNEERARKLWPFDIDID